MQQELITPPPLLSEISLTAIKGRFKNTIKAFCNALPDLILTGALLGIISAVVIEIILLNGVAMKTIASAYPLPAVMQFQ